jgi:hypothetical protein
MRSGSQTLVIWFLLFGALGSQRADAVELYRRIEVKHGISIEIPEHWKVNTLDERKNNAAAVDAFLEGTDGALQPSYITDFSVVSVPAPTGASISMWFRPNSGLTQEQLIQWLESDPEGTALAVRTAAQAKIVDIRKVDEQAGVPIVGDYEGDIGKAGELHGYVIRYRRRALDGVGVFFVHQYYLPIGEHELLATFSYRESDGLLYKSIIEKVMRSLVLSEKSAPLSSLGLQKPN